MQTLMYSILDKGVQAFSQPFSAHNDYAARRVFERSVADPESIMSIKPSDFALFRIGSFDDDLGLISSEDSHPVLISEGLEIYSGLEKSYSSDGTPSVVVSDRVYTQG